jgi:hypothetical protein
LSEDNLRELFLLYETSEYQAKQGMETVVYFCLDTKVPKSQDQYRNGLGSRPPLLKFRKLAALKQSEFLYARKACFQGHFRKGRKIRKQRTLSFVCSRLPFLSAISGKKAVRRMEMPPAYVKKSICLSAASLMDFSKVVAFPSLFGRLGLDLLGRCQKYKPVLFPLSLFGLFEQMWETGSCTATRRTALADFFYRTIDESDGWYAEDDLR